MNTCKHLIIFSIGRSGSTLFQSCCNSIPRVLVRGENNNFHRHLFEAYCSIVDAPERIKSLKSESNMPWYGFDDYRADEYLGVCRDLSRKFLLGSLDETFFEVIGFKEIRLFDVYASLLDNSGSADAELYVVRYLDFLRDIFPQLRIVHLARDVDEVVKSRWWRKVKNQGDLIFKMKSYNCLMSSLCSDPFITRFDYCDLCSDNEVELAFRISEILGLPVDPDEISNVLSYRLTH